MEQKLNHWRESMANNVFFCIVVDICSIIVPAIYLGIYVLGMSIDLCCFLWTGFYSILGNVLIFHQNKVLRLFFTMINGIMLLTTYLYSLIGGWYTLSIALYSTVIPFFELFH